MAPLRLCYPHLLLLQLAHLHLHLLHYRLLHNQMRSYWRFCKMYPQDGVSLHSYVRFFMDTSSIPFCRWMLWAFEFINLEFHFWTAYGILDLPWLAAVSTVQTQHTFCRRWITLPSYPAHRPSWEVVLRGVQGLRPILIPHISGVEQIMPSSKFSVSGWF